MSAADRATQVVAAARALVGVPFRLHGRDRDGLDCVGVAALALGRTGPGAYDCAAAMSRERRTGWRRRGCARWRRAGRATWRWCGRARCSCI